MDSPEHPTEDQILGWLRLYDLERHRPRHARAISASLPRLAHVLWLRHCAEPPLSYRAIAVEYGLREVTVSLLARRGLALLAQVEEQGDLPVRWDPASPLGRAVTLWRLRHRPYVPGPRS